MLQLMFAIGPSRARPNHSVSGDERLNGALCSKEMTINESRLDSSK